MITEKLSKQEINSLEALPIYGFQGVTLIDFPKHQASIVFIGGCNLRCPYCHNKELVFLNPKDRLDYKNILEKIEKRKKIINGVSITGGEPLLYDEIFDFIKVLKEKLQLEVKIDTNGTRYKRLEYIIENKLVDYIAMDFKTIPSKYKLLGIQSEEDLESILISVDILKKTDIPNEYRLTAAPYIIEKDDLEEYGSIVKGGQKLFIQQFYPRNTLSDEYLNVKPYNIKELEKFAQILSKYIPTKIRGI